MINKSELLNFLLDLRKTIDAISKNTNEYLVKGSLLTLDTIEEYLKIKEYKE